jgi:hypothetical protein
VDRDYELEYRQRHPTVDDSTKVQGGKASDAQGQSKPDKDRSDKMQTGKPAKDK